MDREVSLIVEIFEKILEVSTKIKEITEGILFACKKEDIEAFCQLVKERDVFVETFKVLCTQLELVYTLRSEISAEDKVNINGLLKEICETLKRVLCFDGFVINQVFQMKEKIGIQIKNIVKDSYFMSNYCPIKEKPTPKFFDGLQ